MNTKKPLRGLIMVVDDVVENVEVLLRILDFAGYEIAVANNGPSALEQIAVRKPDLVLLDVMMPGGMDGFEVCERLKADNTTNDIPIIFVTALTNTAYIVRGFEVGAVDFITKPFRAKEVLARVNTHMTILRQRREIEQLRERDRIYFEKLSSIKDDVMQMTSHDLKNPLNNVKTAVNLLRRHGRIDDETGTGYLDILDASTSQMQALITGILDLAKLETGQELRKQPAEVGALLDTCVRAFAFNAKDKAVDLRLTPLDQPIYAEIDTKRMEQVFHNLISNAIKYTHKGGSVTLSAEIDTRTVRVNVQDTGVGIPEDDLPHLFEKFYRVKDDQTLDIEGTGLGLSIVQTIVEQHKGRVEVSSAQGEGSTFTVVLPTTSLDELEHSTQESPALRDFQDKK